VLAFDHHASSHRLLTSRDRFDKDLWKAVRHAGISIVEYCRLERLQFAENEWLINFDGENRIFAKYLVDATGRNRVVARKLGVLPRTYDRLIGFTALIPRNKDSDLAHAMLIESTPQGWWYAAPVPQGHVLAFFTDTDLAPHNLPRSMKTVAANSSFAQSRDEEKWATVGDACATHDPLCGWGVHRALSNGILAGDAISRYIRAADRSLLDEYRRHCRTQFESYLQGLSQHYSYEQRWRDYPFWERRTRLMRMFA
jgi:flavin-dependent dehydrogenase